MAATTYRRLRSWRVFVLLYSRTFLHHSTLPIAGCQAVLLKITSTLTFGEVSQTLGSMGSSVVPGCKAYRLVGRCFSKFLLQKRQKREPTSGLEPLSCSLRVINRVFPGVAQVCISPISRPFSLPWLTRYCRMFRPRWCQMVSGVSVVVGRTLADSLHHSLSLRVSGTSVPPFAQTHFGLSPILNTTAQTETEVGTS